MTTRLATARRTDLRRACGTLLDVGFAPAGRSSARESRIEAQTAAKLDAPPGRRRRPRGDGAPPPRGPREVTASGSPSGKAPGARTLRSPGSPGWARRTSGSTSGASRRSGGSPGSRCTSRRRRTPGPGRSSSPSRTPRRPCRRDRAGNRRRRSRSSRCWSTSCSSTTSSSRSIRCCSCRRRRRRCRWRWCSSSSRRPAPGRRRSTSTPPWCRSPSNRRRRSRPWRPPAPPREGALRGPTHTCS